MILAFTHLGDAYQVFLICSNIWTLSLVPILFSWVPHNLLLRGLYAIPFEIGVCGHGNLCPAFHN